MTAHNGYVSLAFEQVGDGGGEPLLLVMGLGMQMIYWPDGLLAEFADAGFTVARFDNRDAGASTHLTWLGAPSLPALVAAPRLVAPYRISDMAADAVAVLDALGLGVRARAGHLARRDDRAGDGDRASRAGCGRSPR